MKSISQILRESAISLVFPLVMVGFLSPVSVLGQCAADFTAKPTTGCVPLEVVYSDASSGASSWNWVFAGGTPSSATGKGPHKVVYHSPGSYDAALVIQCKAGTDEEYKKGFIQATDCGCTANFTASPTSGCEGLEVTFADASVGAVSWVWHFTGGTPDFLEGKGPHKVLYKTAGIYDVELETKCYSGGDNEYKKALIQVQDCGCVADFTASPTFGCEGLEVTFIDASSGAVSWSWHFPGGTPDYLEGKGPHKVLYKTAGIYDVELEIKCQSDGDNEYKKELIQVQDCTCEADFDGNPTDGTAPLTVVFTDQSTNAINWFWSFPGGTPSSMQGQGPHTVVYNDSGDYDVSLQINCSDGEDLLVRDDYIRVEALPLPYDYGDAPEGVIAYPATGVVGAFPTCRASGSAGFIRHRGDMGTFLGNKVDYESDGNAGMCSASGLFDQDELCYEYDSGLWAPDPFTIKDSAGVLQVKPLCDEFVGTSLGEPCETADWIHNISLYYYTDHVDGGAYVNVLIDWDQDGSWGGSSVCESAATPRTTDEHVLKNFPVPGGTAGHLGTLDPPNFLIGPNPGYVWARMTITETPIPLPWDGSGSFDEGETEDVLLKIAPEYRLFDFGDAPFLSLLADDGARHGFFQNIYLGSVIDPEEDGQPGDAATGDDRHGRDDEDGVEFLQTEWLAGDTIQVAVTASVGGMLKAWVDFNQDRDWNDAGEMVLNTQLAAGRNILNIGIPADAKEDSTYARFRFSLQPIAGPGELALDGEVEDYRVFVRVPHHDYGDAPLPFPTRQADAGARHLISDLYFGKSVDWEADGVPSANADADDVIGMDDEDGIEVIPPLIPGYYFDYTIFVSAPGYVTAWIDFNGNGNWEFQEQVKLGRTLYEPRTDHPEMPHRFSKRIPEDAVVGNVIARFRISSTPELPCFGPADDGEVEDHLVPIGAGMDSLDWGDAPDPPYPTLAANDGARHIISNYRVSFGTVDNEPDGQPTTLADGDDLNGLNDELNHYFFLTPLIAGETASIEFLSIENSYINGWIDFNADGDWDDPLEHCLVDHASSGLLEMDTAVVRVPIDAITGFSYGRFRMSADAGIGYSGLAVFGNVEDHRIFLGDPSTCLNDSLALVALYHSTNGDEWTDHSNWLTGPLSSWYGIELDGCRVVRVILGNNNLTGTLPPEIGDLTAMQMLYLRDNEIGGTLPPELGLCTSCVEMDLSNSLISGPIPPELGNMSSLEKLVIENCGLTGTLPPEIGNLIHLYHLSLDMNDLEGEIPSTLYDLIDLQVLHLGSNRLNGTIPPDIGDLANLRYLNLSNNLLQGTLPEELFNLTQLTTLSLSVNEFSGKLSSLIGDLAHLTSLDLYSNQLEGELPAELYHLTEMRYLNLVRNRFNGKISSSIGALADLEELVLAGNGFGGEFPEEVAGLNSLNYIEVTSNRFTHFPDVSALPLLATLRVGINRLTFGDIEPNMGVAIFDYAPQDSLGVQRDTTLAPGMPLELQVSVDGTANVYQWQHNDVDLPGANSAVLFLPAVSEADTGNYICRITNTIAVRLTLYTRPVHLFVNGGTAVQDQSDDIPERYCLEQNYPNPFNPDTYIEYHLPQPSQVMLAIYNLQGQRIRLLADGNQDAGIKHAVWDGCDDYGKKLSSGLYFYRLQAGDYHAVRKMVLLQ